MSTRDALLDLNPSALPVALRTSIHQVSFASYLFVEAARLDAIPLRDVLVWLGIEGARFARAEDPWSDALEDEMTREGSQFDQIYEDLLGRALSLWSRPVDPLDRDVEAWIVWQRHSLDAADPAALQAKMGLTTGDEIRLARLWRERLVDADIAARALKTWNSPKGVLPSLTLVPIPFPPREPSS